ncbi:hypothetical protein HWV62_35178 [Athelia sp. TMB]|nr:hypothetical protein HWV62_35178 [Athelia sp. TMB]
MGSGHWWHHVDLADRSGHIRGFVSEELRSHVPQPNTKNRDILSIYRKVNQHAFLAIDLLVAIGMPSCVWWIIGMSVQVILAIDGYLIQLPIGPISLAFSFSTSVTVVTLSIFYVLYICTTGLVDKLSGRPFLPMYSSDSPRFRRGKLYFLGPQRTPTERAAVVNHVSEYLFQRSVFRKHAFEPTGWAVLRGVVAVYACVGLVVFSAYSSIAEAQAATSDTVVERAIPIGEAGGRYNTLSVTMAAILGQPLPADLTVSRNSDQPLNQTMLSSAVQVWSDLTNYSTNYPYETSDDPRFGVSWTGPVSVAFWATAGVGQNEAFFNGSRITFSPALRLAPFKEYNISLTVVSYKTEESSWLYFQPDIQSVADSATNSALAAFDFVPYQRMVTHLDMSSPSFLILLAHLLSGIGGTYAFLDGLFGLIFGRAIGAILFGTRVISPFGLLGVAMRSRFRRLINEQYPRLQEDINQGGMAAYVNEVAIDAALTATPISACAPVRVASSDSVSGEGGGGRDDISLRNLEPSPGMDIRSTSAGLGLPYEIEDLQFSRKYNREEVKSRDIVAVRRKVSQRLFLAIDIFVAIGLPGCVWPVIVFSIQWIAGVTEGTDLPYYLEDGFVWAFAFSTSIAVVALSTVYVLYLGITALVDKLCGRPFLPIYPGDGPFFSSQGKSGFLGPRRTPTERAAVVNHVSSFLFQNSVFRKHA